MSAPRPPSTDARSAAASASTTEAPMAPPADTTDHLDTTELTAGLEAVRSSPATDGVVEMVVARPAPAQRRVLDHGRLTTHDGLVGDDWQDRYDGAPDVDAQLTLMNARFLDLVSGGERARWPWAGDQLVVDLDLGTANLQPGDRLRVGDALVEVTPKPHRGCKKFVARFGVDAQRLVAGDLGTEARLRGIYVKVVEDGDVDPGDAVTRVA